MDPNRKAMSGQSQSCIGGGVGGSLGDGGLDHDGFDGDVAGGVVHELAGGGVAHGEGAGAGGDAFDFIDDFHAFDDFAEDGVSAVAGEVEGGVVRDVDEELGGGAVGVVGAGHGDGAAVVFEAVLAFVGDAGAGFLFDEFAVFEGEAAALDHEAVDDAMEGGVVVVFGGDVFEEVGGGDGGFLRVELDDEFTVGGFEADFVGCGGRRRGGFSGGGFFGGLLFYGGFLFEAGAEEGDGEEGEESVATFHLRHP